MLSFRNALIPNLICRLFEIANLFSPLFKTFENFLQRRSFLSAVLLTYAVQICGRKTYAEVVVFDAREAKLLEAGKHITLAAYPGLRLEASKTGKKTWIYRYKSPVDGKMRQVKIGSWPAMSIHASIAEWEKLRRRRESGEDPAAAKREQRTVAKAAETAKKKASVEAAYTVRRLCDDYWDGHIRPHRAKKGATEVRRLFDKELVAIEEVPATQVSRAQAFALIQKLGEKKPVIAGQLRTELGAAWDYAIDAGKIPETTPNWWRIILRGKLRSRGKKIAGENVGTTKRVLSEAEVATLIPWLPNMSQMLHDTLTLYLWTCCRGAEIVQMEGREIVEEATGWWWTIPKHKTKNARIDGATDLRVPLFGRAKEIALRRKARYGDGYLFPVRGRLDKPIEQKSIQSSLFVYQPYSEIRAHKYPIRLPVSHWAPHDLRRTSRTILAAMGCPFEVSEAILGHMLPGVAGVYNRHTYDKERLEWLGKLSCRLEELARPQP